MLYSVKKTELFPLKHKKVLEKDVQKLVGENLEKLMGLDFVNFEFSVEKKRIDILAFDREANAPVIIELKKDNSAGLFDQGMEYFNLLSDRKSDFILELHSKLGIPADIKKIDWSASRVVFIGKNFNQRQRRAIDFQGLPIELWSYEWYEDGFFDLEQEGLKKQAKLEIAGIGKNKSEKIAKISTEFVEYDRDYHRKKTSEELWDIFEKIEKEALSFDSVHEKFLKQYLSFCIREGGVNFIELTLRQGKINFYFSVEKNKKPETNLEYKEVINSWVKSYKKFTTEIDLNTDLNEIIRLIRDSYLVFKKSNN